MDRVTARGEALRILLEVEKGKFAQNLIDKSLNQGDWKEEDKRLLNELVLGVIRQRGLLDWLLARFVQEGREKLDKVVLNILRLGLYQKKFLRKIPDYALTSESVNLAKKIRGKKEAGFINAILRNFLRNEDKIVLPDESKDPVLSIAIRFSHPAWLVKKWLEQFGLETTRSLCQFNNQVPPLTIRANTLKTGREALKKELEKEGYRLESTQFSPEGLRVLGDGNIFRHPLFGWGFFYVQDESAMLVSHFLAPRKEEFIIDFCSAPGGKTTHLASLMKGEGKILALDIKREKLEKVKENCQRLGIKNVKTLVFSEENLTKIRKKPEAILLDVPCSNFGVLRRRVEAKWRITPEKILELKKEQLKLLERGAALLKKGGRLIYSTCTLTPEENEEVIKEFLEGNRDFTVDKSSPLFLKRFQTRDGFIRLYPDSFCMDKVFMAKLVKH